MNAEQLESWADQLLEEYEEGRKGLREMNNKLDPESDTDKLDRSHINSMIDSMTFSIDWMETGRQPGLYRGADKRDAYRVKQYDEMDVIPDIKEELRKEREPLYMSQSQKHVFMDVIRNLSNRERQCFIMHIAEQLSMSEIADKLNIKKRTVQQYVERAREKVEKINVQGA